MARLPTTLEQPAPRGATASGSAVDFGGLDRAFQRAAGDVARWDQSRRQADDAEAARVLEEGRQAYAAQSGERAALYDGRQPGFAEAELGQFDATLKPLLDREDLSDGVRRSLGRQARELRVEAGAAAVQLEARARGQRAAADRDAAEQAGAVRALMAAQKTFDGLEDARRAAWDGVAPGYADGLMADWRQASAAAMEGLDEATASRLKPMLLSQEASLQARALSAEDERRDAATLRTVADGLTTLVNRVTRDPSLMGRFDAEADTILDAAPAYLRARLKQETRQQAGEAALEARIQRGEFDAVESEIEAGRHDDLDPGRLTRVRDSVKTARSRGVIEDAQAEADLEAEVQATLRDVLNGKPADPSLVQRARMIGGDALAVKIDTDLKAAEAVRPLIGRLRTMAPEAASAELQVLTERATDAVGARTLELATEMVAQDRRLRGDPAAWAATPTGPGDRIGETVRDRMNAFLTSPSEETAQAWARAGWIAQREANVPLNARRLLPQATAEAWVAQLDADGAAGPGLQSLAARAALFGPDFQPQILRELSLAGLPAGDLGALTQYASSPRRLDLYVRGRGQKPNEAVPDKAIREDLDAALSEALAPWMRTVASREGGQAASEAARVTAYGMVARGSNVRDAVRTATAPMAEGWTFYDTYAVPTSAGVPASRVRGNAGLTVASLVRHNGRGLFTPPSERYSAEQSRRLYADQVRNRAQWRTLADGSGLELVLPDAEGRWSRVRDAAGRDVTRTWAQFDRPPETDGRAR